MKEDGTEGDREGGREGGRSGHLNVRDKNLESDSRGDGRME